MNSQHNLSLLAKASIIYPYWLIDFIEGNHPHLDSWTIVNVTRRTLGDGTFGIKTSSPYFQFALFASNDELLNSIAHFFYQTSSCYSFSYSSIYSSIS